MYTIYPMLSHHSLYIVFCTVSRNLKYVNFVICRHMPWQQERGCGFLIWQSQQSHQLLLTALMTSAVSLLPHAPNHPPTTRTLPTPTTSQLSNKKQKESLIFPPFDGWNGQKNKKEESLSDLFAGAGRFVNFWGWNCYSCGFAGEKLGSIKS